MITTLALTQKTLVAMVLESKSTTILEQVAMVIKTIRIMVNFMVIRMIRGKLL